MPIAVGNNGGGDGQPCLLCRGLSKRRRRPCSLRSLILELLDNRIRFSVRVTLGHGEHRTTSTPISSEYEEPASLLAIPSSATWGKRAYVFPRPFLPKKWKHTCGIRTLHAKASASNTAQDMAGGIAHQHQGHGARSWLTSAVWTQIEQTPPNRADHAP